MGAFASLLALPLIKGIPGILNGIIGANAAGNAADAQVAGEQQVLDLTKQTTGQAQGDISGSVAGANSTIGDYYTKGQALLSPYEASGTSALSQLNALTQGGGFQAPTGVSEQNDPGYQARMALGQQAVERSAAAKGGALGGAAGKELTQFGQDYGSNEYGNVYNRALGTYQTNFGNLQQLAGLGLNATNTGVNAGTTAGSQIGSNTVTGGLSQAQNLMQGLGISADALTGAANARASGYVGQANAYQNTVTGLGNTAMGVYGANQQNQLQKILDALKNQTGSTPGTGTPTV